jgi:neutral amino acid transport system ATP-binding protein
VAEPLMEARDVRRSYGGVHAVDGASFAVAPASITGLIGPNGAGKTTLFDVLSGFRRPHAGSVRYDGAAITGWSPHRRAQHGLVRTFQLTRALAGMSVLDNMLLGAGGHPGERLPGLLLAPRGWRRRERAERARAAQLLEVLGLEAKAGDYAGVLSGGQRKLLELGRVLMGRPRLVLLDEPMAGVNPSLGLRLIDHVHRLRDEEGIAFLVIEHDLDLIMTRTDRVVVMAQGRVIASGTPGEVAADAAVVDAYLGRPAGGDA